MSNEGIKSMITQYGELNRICDDILSGKKLFIEKYKFISEFLRTYVDIQSFEAVLLDAYTEMKTEQISLLVNSLFLEIKNSISKYKDNKFFFDNFDTFRIYNSYISRFDPQIERQGKVTSEYSEYLKEASNNLESIAFNFHTKEEEERLNRRYDQCKKDYDEEKAKLDELYEEKMRAKHEASPCMDNRFHEIFELGINLLDVLNKYMTDQIKKDSVPYKFDANKEFFSMKLASFIHEECNGKQFENISEIDFYYNINLMPHTCKLRCKPNEKTRVCYLISLMIEKVNREYKDEWKSGIMKILDIDESYYKSKYKEPISDVPTKNNKCFVEKIDPIFNLF